jgi:L-amino acid N-acyltransferase YncA
MRLINCNYVLHGEAVRAIFNDAIANSTALFDYEPRMAQVVEAWFAQRERSGIPVLGIEDAAGELLGFASYGIFRAAPAYQYSMEHSVYVREDHRGRGLGKRLLKELIEAARARGVHVLVGVIESRNLPSIALHEALGFTLAGLLKESGFKFGRWLDVSLYQLILTTPANPKEE